MSQCDGTKSKNILGLPSEKLEHAVQKSTENLAQQRRVVREEVSQRWRKAQNPMTDRCVADHMVSQKSGPIIHPAAKAGWTPTPAFARMRHQPIVPTPPAMDPGKSTVQVAAIYELLELPPYECWKGPVFRLTERDETPVVFLDDPIEHGLMGPAALVFPRQFGKVLERVRTGHERRLHGATLRVDAQGRPWTLEDTYRQWQRHSMDCAQRPHCSESARSVSWAVSHSVEAFSRPAWASSS